MKEPGRISRASRQHTHICAPLYRAFRSSPSQVHVVPYKVYLLSRAAEYHGPNPEGNECKDSTSPSRVSANVTERGQAGCLHIRLVSMWRPSDA